MAPDTSPRSPRESADREGAPSAPDSPESPGSPEAAKAAKAAKSPEPAASAAPAAPAAPAQQAPIGKGPGTLLVTLYGIFTVGAASRSIVQLTTRFEEAPLAYVLSAVAALVYAFITLSLVRGGERARRAAFACCCVELLGVLAVGTWTLVEPSAFPDATVWSDYGMGYLFIPVILPVTGLMWLRRSRAGAPRAGAD